MPSINVDLTYPVHPKTVRLKAWLGETGDIYPIRLWAYVGQMHPKDGHLRGYTIEQIERLVDWRGDPGQCVKALLDPKIRFLEATKDGYKCRKWRLWQGHIWAFRIRNQKAAVSKWKKIRESKSIDDKRRNATGIPQVSHAESPTRAEQSRAEHNDTQSARVLIWGIGKTHAGKPISALPADYCRWALGPDGPELQTETRQAVEARLAELEKPPQSVRCGWHEDDGSPCHGTALVNKPVCMRHEWDWEQARVKKPEEPA